MSSKIYYAIIKNREDIKAENIFDVPIFCGNNINLFNPILKKTISIQGESESENEYDSWIATFFKDSQYAQTLELEVVDKENYKQIPQDLKKDIARIVVITNTDESDEGMKTFGDDIEKYCEEASQFIRGSNSLKFGNLTQISNGWRHIDGRGLLIVNKYRCIKQSKRATLLLMLAIGYYQAFQNINEQLAEVLSLPHNVDRVDELFSIASEFDARYYFFNPIQVSNFHTYKCWENIRDAYDLQLKYLETNEQIQQVHLILNHRTQKKEEAVRHIQQEKDDKWTKKITTFAVILSVLGLIEVAHTLKEWFF